MGQSRNKHRVGCALGVFMLLPAVILGFDFFGSHKEYSVVIDAGSSSSKLLVSVFHKDSGKLHLDKHELYETFQPGLSDFYGDPDGIKEQIEKILKRAEDFIPKSKWDDSPVTFRATAGFRLLSEERRDYLLEEVRKILQNSKFKKPANTASILSESDEGLFAWVSANLLLDRLHSSPDDMVATLDLGGASTQITFPLTHALFRQFPLQVRWVPVAGQRVNFYTRSYMGLGMGAATVAVLMKSKHEYSDLYDTPCVSVRDNGKIYHYNGQSYTVYRSTTSQEDEDVNIEECTSLVQNFVWSYNIRNYDPLPNYEIHAFSGFFYALRDAGLVDAKTGGRISVSQIKDTANKVCQRKEPQEDPFLCLHLIYIYTLLTEGYKIAPTEEIMISDKVNGHHINWAMGLAYYNLELENGQ